MDEWNDKQPIYQQLRERVIAMILDGTLKEGDPLPSVRTVAAEFRINPLTVLKSWQFLVDEGLVEKKRGRGMFINDGARKLLLEGERRRFLEEEWQAFEGAVLPEGKQRRAELVFAAEFGVGVFAGEQVADDLGLERGRESTSLASWHDGVSFGASIHIVLVSPKGRTTTLPITTFYT